MKGKFDVDFSLVPKSTVFNLPCSYSQFLEKSGIFTNQREDYTHHSDLEILFLSFSVLFIFN